MFLMMPFQPLSALLTAGTGIDDPAYEQTRTLNIVYTGSINGELEPCGCSPKTDFGGVARRGGYLRGHRKTLFPYILIDSGNFLSKDTPQGRLKAEAMIKSMSIMKYDVVAFLRNEKGFSYDFLSPLLRKFKIPAISDAPPYRQSTTIRCGGMIINVSAEPKDYKNGKLNILLTDRTITEASSLKGWDVIILSQAKEGPSELENPIRVNETVIVRGYPKGQKLGILSLKVDRKGKVIDFRHRWQPLGRDVREDPALRRVLKEYDNKVARLLRNHYTPPEKTVYLGVSKCIECHQPFVEGWKKTKHASAFATLQRVGKSNDPECIKCHTVGSGEEGGFHRIETTPHLSNVQCEACHGPGRDHLLDFSKPMQPVVEYVCLKCHTKSTSPDFNYPVYLEKVKHK